MLAISGAGGIISAFVAIIETRDSRNHNISRDEKTLTTVAGCRVERASEAARRTV